MVTAIYREVSSVGSDHLALFFFGLRRVSFCGVKPDDGIHSLVEDIWSCHFKFTLLLL